MERTEFSPEHHEVAPMSGFQKVLSAHRNRERGAVLVEAAIAIPLLLFVILGSLEFGVGWEAKSATTAGLRSGLLRASTLADDPQTDLRTLQSIIGEVGADNADRIQWVVIFDADPANGDLNSIVDACRDAVLAGSLESFCVGYSQQTVIDIATTTNIDASNFDPSVNATCDVGLLDEGQFCATSRILNGDIEIGVAFEYEHSWLTGILPFDSPRFREVQISSTFADDGADINGTNAITNPASVAPGTNLATNASVLNQSSVGHGGAIERAFDGNTSGAWGDGSITHSNKETDPFFDLDLGAVFSISDLVVWNRDNSSCSGVPTCAHRLEDFTIFISDQPFPSESFADTQAAAQMPGSSITAISFTGFPDPDAAIPTPSGTTGRYVRIQIGGTDKILSVAELEIIAG